jgi:hypothetical protein
VRRLLAVLGRDVSRSRSPELHARAAAVLGLDVAYVPVCCADEAHFDRAVLALGTLGARGANVTIPYKARALAQATVVSARAEQLGAANVLSFEPDGAVLADNTDGPALVDVLGAYDPRSLERVVVLGAGGAARAVVWALGQVGAREVVVCARDPAQAERLVGLAPGARAAGLEAVEASLVVSSLPGDPSLARVALDRWGELLVRENLISLQQLQQAQEEQRKTGGRLGYNLTKLGYIEENELTQFLSKQYGVPAINLSEFEIDQEVIRLVPKEVAEKHQVIPVNRAGASLIVAMADPSNIFAIDDLKFLTGYNIEVVVASDGAIRDAIDRYYGEKAEQKEPTTRR